MLMLHWLGRELSDGQSDRWSRQASGHPWSLSFSSSRVAPILAGLALRRGIRWGIASHHGLRKDPDLIERRLQIGPTAENRPIQKVIVAFIRPLFLLLLLIPGLDHRFGWSRVPTWLVIAADIALLLGYVIIFFVFKANSFTAGVVTVAPTQRVISTGPYAVVRHPMYSGGLLVMLTTPIALSSWCGLPVTLAMLVGLVLRLQDEEKLLREQLPGYEEYYHRVRYRLIPGIW
jgi:protein-S-isoprenylcysteine O-methyltransferase Ste14